MGKRGLTRFPSRTKILLAKGRKGNFNFITFLCRMDKGIEVGGEFCMQIEWDQHLF